MSNDKENNKAKKQDPFEDEVILALFRKGAREYLEKDLLNDLPDGIEESEKELHKDSNKKIEKMITRAIRKEKNRHRIKQLPRVAAIFLIVIVVCSITVMSVEAFRTPFLNLFINTKEEITDIEIEEDQVNDDETSLADLFVYIPEGYELTSEDIQEQAATFIYMNDNEDSIDIYRYDGEGSLGLDTENAEYGEILINSYQGFYSIKNGASSLVFTKNGYTYFIQANVDLSEIVKIAENIK